ncbi:MAG: hypothetical protein NT085_00985 [candidate division SR1 bacterium]|nr:hypothetical protein [candidate division SR1 bacterium]
MKLIKLFWLLYKSRWGDKQPGENKVSDMLYMLYPPVAMAIGIVVLFVNNTVGLFIYGIATVLLFVPWTVMSYIDRKITRPSEESIEDLIKIRKKCKIVVFIGITLFAIWLIYGHYHLYFKLF